jgi:hypothetical protein
MWLTVEENLGRPGYLGKHKKKKFASWDRIYGKGNWRLIWLYSGFEINFLQVCQVYEHAYYVYLDTNPDVLNGLVRTASDVYDDAISNVRSGRDYKIQETERTHIQDIAIRNVLNRLGRKFEGDRLIQIRHDKGDQPLSMTLSPGVVPFHNIGEIMMPWLRGWWNFGSVECFYQSNRLLQLRR